jgi:hypothetical protein
VLAAIVAPPASAAPPRRPALAFATIATAVAIFGAGLALAVPSSRSAIADFFGIEGSKIERLPPPLPGVTPTPFPPASELPAGAQPATLEEVSRALGFEAAFPEGLGVPQAVYLIDYGRESAAVLRYANLDLWEAKPRSGITYGKGLPEGVILLELTTAGGRDVYFIEGGPHIVRLFDDDSAIPGSERTVERNTLVFSTERAFYRIETDLPRSEALLRIADSLP